MKQILILCLLFIPLLFSGCVIYGEGKTYGFVEGVESGIIWDKVYIKPTLESSQEDCFVISKDTLIKDILDRYAKEAARTEIKYHRHIFTLSYDCNYGNDEVYDINIIDGGK